MKRFSALYEALDRTTSTNEKVAALAAYFRDAPPGDAAWATFFLTGRRLKRVVPSAGLAAWSQEVTGLPDWLLRECYSAAHSFQPSAGYQRRMRSAVRGGQPRCTSAAIWCQSTWPAAASATGQGMPRRTSRATRHSCTGSCFPMISWRSGGSVSSIVSSGHSI